MYIAIFQAKSTARLSYIHISMPIYLHTREYIHSKVVLNRYIHSQTKISTISTCYHRKLALSPNSVELRLYCRTVPRKFVFDYIGSKCFHKIFELFVVGKICTEDSFV